MALSNVFKRFEEDLLALPLATKPESLYDPVRYTLRLGGKHIRPRLVLLATAMCNRNPEVALPAAKAVELLHVFTLIHDDIMDNADTRRGKATVAKKWGVNQAILSGDVLFGMAMEQLNELSALPHLEKKAFAAMYSCFLQAVRTVCEGQALDMEFEQRNDVTKGEYLQMIGAKTAALLAASVELGVRVAGVSDDLAQAAFDFGWNTGLAFQIQDDLLDAVGDSQKTGKMVGGDIREGKKTYLTLTALEKSQNPITSELRALMAVPKRNDDEVQRVIRIYHETETIEETERAIRHHYDLALQNLAKFPENDAHDEIKKLLEQLMQREK